MSLAASYEGLAGALGGYVESLRDRVEDCHRSREVAEDVLDVPPGRPGGRPRWRGATRWSDSVLGQILGWNPAPTGGSLNSWRGPGSSSGGDD